MALSSQMNAYEIKTEGDQAQLNVYVFFSKALLESGDKEALVHIVGQEARKVAEDAISNRLEIANAKTQEDKDWEAQQAFPRDNGDMGYP